MRRLSPGEREATREVDAGGGPEPGRPMPQRLRVGPLTSCAGSWPSRCAGHFFLTKLVDDWEATHVAALAAARRCGDLVADDHDEEQTLASRLCLRWAAPDAANEHFQTVA